MLEPLLYEYIMDTENPILNYKMGLEYEKIGQTAAAISYLLRAAERSKDKLLSYECLLRVGRCFEKQKNRNYTVKSMYRNAIDLCPDRPEAYYLLARNYNSEQNYADSFLICSMANNNCKEHTYSDIGSDYPGRWGLYYHEAIASWWYGKNKRSRRLFKTLKRLYWNDMDNSHREEVDNYMNTIESKLGPEQIKTVDYFTFYAPTMKEILRLRLHMLKDYVDEFVITECNKTHSGEPTEYKLESILKEIGFDHLNIRIIKVDIPDDENLEILEIDRLNCMSSGNHDNINSLRARVRERMGIDGILSVLDNYADDTVFILNDADEIMKPEAIGWISNIVKQNPQCIIRIPIVLLEGRADRRVYDRNTNLPMEWTGTVITTREHLKKATPAQMRSNMMNPFPINFVSENNNRIEDLGWHFSSMGGREIVKQKLKTFCHYDDILYATEFNDRMSSIRKMDFIDSTTLEEENFGIIDKKDRILKKYPIEDLPRAIFELPTVEKHLFPEYTKTSKNDSKSKIEKIYPEYDAKYGDWGWISLDKAGCLIDYVDEICRDIENPICVEIGVYAGKSILPVALELKRNAKGVIFAIDPWTNEEATRGYEGPHYQYWSKVNLQEKLQLFKTMINEFELSEYVVPIKETSDRAPEFKNINLLHIDGQHTDQALRDAKKYAVNIELNGYCIVDDVDWGEVENVPKFLEKIGFVPIHSIGSTAIFKKLCYRTDVEI
jgi:tetratricopeptide (TPR) repeat protein